MPIYLKSLEVCCYIDIPLAFSSGYIYIAANFL